MTFQEISTALYEIQLKIAIKHSSENSDLFIEFIKQKRELEDKLDSFKKFTLSSFKNELEDEK